MGAKLAEGIPGRDRQELAHRWFDCMEDKARSEFHTDDTGAENIVMQKILGKPWPETVEALQRFDGECRKKLREEVWRQQEERLRHTMQQQWSPDGDKTEPMPEPEEEWKKEENWDDHLFNSVNDAARKLGKAVGNSITRNGAAPGWHGMENALPRFRMRDSPVI